MIQWLKNKIAKLLWSGNPWTKAVDSIENAVYELRKGEINVIDIKWQFKFLKTPPSNKFVCRITLDTNYLS